MCIGSSFLSSPGHKPGKVTPMAPFSSCDPTSAAGQPTRSSSQQHVGPSPWEVKEGGGWNEGLQPSYYQVRMAIPELTRSFLRGRVGGPPSLKGSRGPPGTGVWLEAEQSLAAQGSGVLA